MRRLSRSLVLVATALFAHGRIARAQEVGEDSFKWYVGAQTGITGFRTQSQGYKGAFTFGVHMLVTARRTGIILALEEGFKNNQGTGTFAFNDTRRYSATLVAFPFRSHLQPYFGIGAGIFESVNEYPENDANNSAGSFGYASLLAGLQARAGTSLVVFGQVDIMSSPASTKAFRGFSNTFLAGLRVGLGGAREDVGAGGY
jgi:hypothetical protein